MRRQVSAQKTARIGLPDENAHAPTRSSTSTTCTTACCRPRICSTSWLRRGKARR